MELSPDAFNAHLRKMGHDMAWRRSYACPCVSPSSGSADQRCVHCGGKGRMWDGEVVGRCGFVNMSAKKGMADFGVWEPGDAVLSIGSDCPFYELGRFDRFRSLSSMQRFTDNLRRGFNEKLLGTIERIDRVFWLNSQKNIVEGSIPTVGEGGVLTWPDSGPPEGTVFSIAGVRWDEWFAYLDMPQNRPMHGGAALPRRLPVRKFDLFGR